MMARGFRAVCVAPAPRKAELQPEGLCIPGRRRKIIPPGGRQKENPGRESNAFFSASPQPLEIVW